MLAFAAMLAVAFLVCAWSGRVLAHHYQDGAEVGAVLAIAGCVVFALVATDAGREGTGAGWSETVLAVAMSAGLFAGYLRSGGRLR